MGATACVPPRARDASTLARLLAETIEEAHEAALSQKSSASRDTWLLQADEYKQTVDAYLAARTHDAKGLLSLCAACPWPSGRFGSKEYKAVAAELQARCAEIIQEARCLLAEPLLEDVLGVARSAFDVYRRAKRASMKASLLNSPISSSLSWSTNSRIPTSFKWI